MNALQILAAHFEARAEAGTPRAVWWRDDDARRPGPNLDALAGIAAAAGAPLALAVIPDGVDPELLSWCEGRGIDVLQHGVRHDNHQTAGKSAELGDARTVEAILAELLAARENLRSAAFVPVLVPPWNRMREDLDAALAAEGYLGLSRFGGAPRAGPPRRVDTHIDPIAWRTTRSLVADDALAGMTAKAIAGDGPIGLLTHHIDHDAALWAFVAAFAALVGQHPGARWVGARQLFAGDGHE